MERCPDPLRQYLRRREGDAGADVTEGELEFEVCLRRRQVADGARKDRQLVIAWGKTRRVPIDFRGSEIANGDIPVVVGVRLAALGQAELRRAAHAARSGAG